MAHDVFISYSRKDIAFARLLHESLQKTQLETWIDWARIPVGEKWWDEICAAIESADVFLFIISQYSIGSNVCKDEIAQAQRHNKRLIPIVVDDTPEAAIRAFAPNLAAINWILFKQDDVFRLEARGDESLKPDDRQAALPKKPQFLAALEKLNAAIHTDWAWVKAHTRLETRAREWERRKREGSLLLRGNDLREAEQLLAHAGKGKDPQPTDLQRQYVLASRRSQERRQRITLSAVVIGSLIAIVLAIVAWTQRAAAVSEANSRATAEVVALTEADNRATAEAQALSQKATAEIASTQAVEQRDEALRQARLAQARELASRSQFEQNYGDRLLGLLLAIEAQLNAAQAGLHVPIAEQALRDALADHGGILLRGHTKPIAALAFSPDGRKLVTGSWDRTARIWEMNDLKAEPIILHGHEDWVQIIAFSPDGRWLVTGSADDTARVWDADNLMAQSIVLGNSDTHGVYQLAFSPNGRWLAIGGVVDTQMWDMDNLSAAPFLLLGEITGLSAFSPDGHWFITSVGLWDMTKANPVAEPIVLHGYDERTHITTAAFSPDGRWLATGRDDVVQVWNMHNLTVEPISLQGFKFRINTLVFSPDGHWLAAGSGDELLRVTDSSESTNPLRVWDMQDLTVEVVTPGGYNESSVEALAFSPDARWLVTDGELFTVPVWDLNNLSAEPVALGGSATVLAFSPDGRWLATGDLYGTVQVWLMDLDALLTQACGEVGRNLTQAEWKQYLGDRPYHKTCEQWPEGK